ncbi:energy-coupling factor transporter transmembrane component T [Streptococcus sp. 20-1249]|uniref:energy-coupling factor transporter transmembrane component T n=1 Tax=Streptococcus hepaticus TaxID=3349163 RepID=UPI0037486290
MTLDIRSKILLLLLTNWVLLYHIEGWIYWGEISLILGLLLFVYGQWKRASLYLLYFLLANSYAYWSESISFTNENEFFSLLFIGFRQLLPCFMVGGLIVRTTNSYEGLHGLRKWHLPEPIVLTLGVMLTFLPILPQQAQAIHQALRLRGIFLRKRDVLFHPIQYGEYLLIPLLMATLRRAQELTMALMTKGITPHTRPQEFFTSKWNWLDWGISLCSIGLCLFISLSSLPTP